MAPEKLVRMANQIAIFFDSQPGEKAVGDGAPAEFANHIVKFWEERMIDHLRTHAAAGGEGLRPSVMAAVALLPQAREPMRD